MYIKLMHKFNTPIYSEINPNLPFKLLKNPGVYIFEDQGGGGMKIKHVR